MATRTQDRKEEAFEWLPRADQIAPYKVFRKGDGTAQMLMRETGMSNKAALNNLARLKAEGRAHIHAWTATANPSAVYVRGPGEDAPKPPPKPQSEVVARYHAKLAREKEQRQANGATVVDSRTRTARTIEQARSQPAQWWSSLGTMPAVPAEDAA